MLHQQEHASQSAAETKQDDAAAAEPAEAASEEPTAETAETPLTDPERVVSSSSSSQKKRGRDKSDPEPISPSAVDNDVAEDDATPSVLPDDTVARPDVSHEASGRASKRKKQNDDDSSSIPHVESSAIVSDKDNSARRPPSTTSASSHVVPMDSATSTPTPQSSHDADPAVVQLLPSESDAFDDEDDERGDSPEPSPSSTSVAVGKSEIDTEIDVGERSVAARESRARDEPSSRSSVFARLKAPAADAPSEHLQSSLPGVAAKLPPSLAARLNKAPVDAHVRDDGGRQATSEGDAPRKIKPVRVFEKVKEAVMVEAQRQQAQPAVVDSSDNIISLLSSGDGEPTLSLERRWTISLSFEADGGGAVGRVPLWDVREAIEKRCKKLLDGIALEPAGVLGKGGPTPHTSGGGLAFECHFASENAANGVVAALNEQRFKFSGVASATVARCTLQDNVSDSTPWRDVFPPQQFDRKPHGERSDTVF